MSYWIFIILVFAGVILEGVLTTIPVTLCMLLLGYLVKKDPGIFVVAFFAGIVLDIVLVRNIGQDSLFFVVFLFVIFLYERKFEVKTIPFTFFASFFGSFFYLLFVGEASALQSVVAALFASILFFIIQRFSPQSLPNSGQ